MHELRIGTFWESLIYPWGRWSGGLNQDEHLHILMDIARKAYMWNLGRWAHVGYHHLWMGCGPTVAFRRNNALVLVICSWDLLFHIARSIAVVKSMCFMWLQRTPHLINKFLRFSFPVCLLFSCSANVVLTSCHEIFTNSLNDEMECRFTSVASLNWGEWKVCWMARQLFRGTVNSLNKLEREPDRNFSKVKTARKKTKKAS